MYIYIYTYHIIWLYGYMVTWLYSYIYIYIYKYMSVHVYLFIVYVTAWYPCHLRQCHPWPCHPRSVLPDNHAPQARLNPRICEAAPWEKNDEIPRWIHRKSPCLMEHDHIFIGNKWPSPSKFKVITNPNQSESIQINPNWTRFSREFSWGLENHNRNGTSWNILEADPGHIL